MKVDAWVQEARQYNKLDKHTQLVIALNYFMETGAITYKQAQQRLLAECIK